MVPLAIRAMRGAEAELIPEETELIPAETMGREILQGGTAERTAMEEWTAMAGSGAVAELTPSRP
jgi:hypothetical protein